MKEGFAYDKNHGKQGVKETIGPNVQTTKSVALSTQYLWKFYNMLGTILDILVSEK